MNRIKLYELMGLVTTQSFNWTITYNNKTFSNVVSTSRFKNRAEQVHGEKSFFYYGNSPLTVFMKLWDDFKETKKDDFGVLLYGLTKEYDPMFNYDKTLTSTTAFKGGSTSTGTTTDTATNTVVGSSSDINTRTGSVTNEHSVKPYDSTSYKATEKDTESYSSVQDERAVTNDSTSTTDNNGTSSNTMTYNNRQDEVNLHEFGNIGVQTGADIISKELEVRSKYNIMELIVDMFINEYCSYMFVD